MNDHHHHHHGHAHEQPTEMTMEQKLDKLVDHWIKHNRDHGETYRQWAQKARDEHMEKVAELLETVAEESQQVNATLESVREALHAEGKS